MTEAGKCKTLFLLNKKSGEMGGLWFAGDPSNPADVKSANTVFHNMFRCEPTDPVISRQFVFPLRESTPGDSVEH